MNDPENGITDIFFDLDHTLWDFERNSALAFAAVFEKNKVNLPLDDFLSHYVPINHAYWHRYQSGALSKQELRYGRLRDAFALMGYNASQQELHNCSEDYMDLLPSNNHLFEGTLDVLAYLSQRYRLHIITNGFSQVQVRKIEGSGIGHYFSTITDSDKAGVKKPDSKIFSYALQAAGTRHANALMIGDSLEADVLGAIDCGIDAIYCNFSGADAPRGVRQIRNLLELKKLL